MKVFARLLVNTAAILITAYILNGVHVDSIMTGFITALILGVLNTFIRPLLVFLTLPVTVLTLGLFLLIINTFLVMLADYLIPGLMIDSFLYALVFSLGVSFIGSFLYKIVK